MSTIPAFIRLDGPACSLVIDCRGPAPAALHWGPKLATAVTGEMLALAAAREEAPCSPLEAPPLALTPLAGQGFPGRPGLQAHGQGGRRWSTYTSIEEVRSLGPGVAEIRSVDKANCIELIHHLALAPDDNVLAGWTQVRNLGLDELEIGWCAAPVLPLPPEMVEWVSFEGRWSGEFQMRTLPRALGALNRENRRGRTSHDAFPALLAQEAGAREQVGEVYGWHLGWSGNHAIHAESLSDGRAYVQMGELLLPGEMRLAPGAAYRTPTLYAAWSGSGRNGLSAGFHAHIRARPQHQRLRAKPRPIHYNTWEAVYFNHDPARLLRLADAAAAMGVERFVLDDGWFKGRRDDKAGLGDWFVDRSVYPEGLHPLAKRVRDHGMEFGLWVEPEMVNPDSDLYRTHPDWVLGTPPAPQLIFRNQLVLDASRDDVQDYLFGCIDALLREYPISYLKWDMNRDLNHPGGVDGAAAAHAHVQGLYRLLARVRAAHPTVEVESCASGGGRADLGVLEWTDRVWTSDNNDALDRQFIQRGLSHFLPFELMGAHVGPTDCHITGRRISMTTRVATAMFGHMGLEVDLLGLTEEERRELAAGIALHKKHRALIHSGTLVRLDRPTNEVAYGVIAADGGEALFSYTQISEQAGYYPGRLRLAGLSADARYKVILVWPEQLRSNSPLMQSLKEGAVFSGDLLMNIGLQLPRQHPQSALVFAITRQR